MTFGKSIVDLRLGIIGSVGGLSMSRIVSPKAITKIGGMMIGHSTAIHIAGAAFTSLFCHDPLG